MKKINDIMKDLIIIFLLIILASVCYSKFIEKDDVIKIFGKSFLIVNTGSMEPTINAGELIIIDEKVNYQKGDVVTYLDNENYLITHRIIEIDKDEFITKGDANNLNDEKNDIQNIKGKVIFHSKILGIFVIYILKPLTVVYMIIFIMMCFIKNKKENKEENNEEEIKNCDI